MSFIGDLYRILLKPLPDEQYSVFEHFRHLHRFPDLRKPKTFNEKILWIKLNYRNRLLIQCTDKFLVRDYVRSVLPEDALVPLLGVYERAQDISYSALPDQFILKANHGSGWNVLCRSKSSFDHQTATIKLSKYLRSNFYNVQREWAYKEIKPQIICEALLLDDEGNIPKDYKVYCFNGEPKFLQVHYDRFTEHTTNFYDLDWHRMPCALKYPNHAERNSSPPEALSKLLTIAQRLSTPFPFVRVDLYVLGTRVFFGELTFYPEAGIGKFLPPEYDYIFGNYLDLRAIQNSQ